MPSTRPFSTCRAQPWRWTIILLVLLALAPAAALAQDTGTADTNSPPAAGSPPLVASESTLVFRGSTGEPLGRTFTLKAVGDPVGNVRISVGDLLEKDGRVILATQITVDPATIEDLDDEHTVTVTVDPGAAKSGTYTGTLTVWYATPPTALPIELQVTLIGVPNVSADPNSNNQTLFAQTRSIPFVGVATAPQDAEPKPLGTLPIALIEGAQEPAQVIQAEVLPVRNSEGLTLPKGVVSIDTPSGEPLKIPPNGAATLSLAVAGSSLPAGAYTGSVRILVENQPTVVSVPFTMKLKDGALWALLVLFASLVVGIAVGWYNTRGGPARKNISKIDEHRKRLADNPGHLQIEEHNRASDLLNEAMDAVHYQESQTVIDQRLLAFVTYVDEQAQAVKALQAEIRKVRARVDALSGAPDVQRDLLERLSALQEAIVEIKLASLAEGQRQLDVIDGELSALRTLMSDRLDDLLATAQDLTFGQAARDQLVMQLTALRQRLATAEPDVFGQINAEIDTLGRGVDDLANLQDVLAEAAQQGGRAAADTMNAAVTLSDLRQRLEALQQQIMLTAKSPEGAEGLHAPSPPPFTIPPQAPTAPMRLDDLMGTMAQAPKAPAETKEQRWKSFTLGVRWRTALIQGLVYVFALLVGWAALYLPNATFGARPEDYITLFLWGATVNVIAGQQIKLEAIWGHKVQEVKLDAQTPAAGENKPGGTPAPEEP